MIDEDFSTGTNISSARQRYERASQKHRNNDPNAANGNVKYSENKLTEIKELRDKNGLLFDPLFEILTETFFIVLIFITLQTRYY